MLKQEFHARHHHANNAPPVLAPCIHALQMQVRHSLVAKTWCWTCSICPWAMMRGARPRVPQQPAGRATPRSCSWRHACGVRRMQQVRPGKETEACKRAGILGSMFAFGFLHFISGKATEGRRPDQEWIQANLQGNDCGRALGIGHQ